MESRQIYDYDPSLVTFPVEMTTLVATSMDAYSSPLSALTTNINEDEVCAVCLDNLCSNSNSNSEEATTTITKNTSINYIDDDNNLNSNSNSSNWSEDDGDGDKKEVRVLVHNCHHMFHRGCLHAWVAGGRVTCPVCRAKLLADHSKEEVEKKEAHKGFGPEGSLPSNWDPWRLERMIYLFGEDMMF